MKPEDKELEEWLNSELEYDLKEYTEKASELLNVDEPKVVIDWYHICDGKDKDYEDCALASYSDEEEIYVPPDCLHNPHLTEYLVLHEILHHKGLGEKDMNEKISSLRPDLRPVIFSLYDHCLIEGKYPNIKKQQN